jgi:hypothetical protein
MMARSHFGGTSTDWLLEPYKFGQSTLLAARDGSTVLTFYSAATGGTQYTDLLDTNGNPTDRITVAGHLVPEFQGPDGILAMWADKGDGSPREKLEAQDLAAAATAVSSATASATAAAASAATASTAATTASTAAVNAIKDSVGFYVRSYYPNSSPTAAQQHTALQAACAAATAAGGVVILDPGTTKVVGSFSMSGYNCGIVGQGSTTVSSSSNVPLGSVIECTSQTGPVLDFTGYVPPHNFVGRRVFSGFTVKGDGTADSSSDALGSVTVGGGTKKGIYIPSLAALACTFEKITITNCGGIHLDVTDMYLSSVRDIIVTDPISAVANNVPFVRMRACNGTDVYNLGVRVLATGNATTANVGTIGAIWLEGSTGANGYWDRGAFHGCWSENCWLSTGGTIVLTKTHGNMHRDWMHYDARKITGATGTSYMRLEPSNLAGSVAGNLVSGFIQGSNRGTNDIDTGVQLAQSNNRVEGIKGSPGHNVTIDSTIRESYILLGGAGAAAATTVAVDDNSARQDNTYIDATTSVEVIGNGSGSTTASRTMSGQHIRENRVTATQSVPGTLTPDMTAGATLFAWTLASTGITIGGPTDTNQRERTLRIVLKQDATGSRTLSSWSGAYAWKSGVAPTLKTAASAVDTFQFVYDGSLWQQI